MFTIISCCSEINVRYSLNTTTSNLLAFSIYGNYYDGIEGKGDGAASVTISILCGLFVFLSYLF